MNLRVRRTLTGCLLVIMMVTSALSLQVPSAQAADEYDALRTKWKELLIGGAYSASDPDIAAQISAITSTANSYWSSMDSSAGRTYLWSDLNAWSASATMTSTYSRLYSMSVAYATTGSSLYGNASLLADLLGAIDWMAANKYNASKTQSDNWWDWQIGTPQALSNLLVLLYDSLNASQLTSYVNVIDKFVADPTKRYNSTVTETGANRTDKAQVVIVRGMLEKSGTKIAQGRDALSQVFLYVTSGDGFYAGGSFIQHTNIAYNGSYGRVLIAGLSKQLYLLDASSWEVTDANAANVYNWVNDSFRPLIYKGAMMDMVRGRAIAREAQQDHAMGRDVIASLARLALAAPATDQSSIQSMVKAWVQQDTSFASYYSGLPIADIVNMKAIMANSAIAPASAPTRNLVYNSMARAVHLQPGFGFGLSLFSSRIGRYEAGNGENQRGWHTGEGMTYLYNNDLTQYSDGYWATVNPYRLAGITVDPLALTDAQGSASVSTYNFVGGVSNETNGVAGMRFTGLGVDLNGRKSWFMLGDKIVALGSSIASTSGRAIETIVENRKLNASGSNTLTVGGTAKSSSIGWSETMIGVSWAHLQGSVSGSDIGYYFPGTSTVAGLRESRGGSWSQVNTSGSTSSITRSYLSLAIPHGTSPTNATYAYVLLPNRTASQTAAYAANSDIAVLENSDTAQAVSDAATGTVGVNFWLNASKTISVGGAAYLISDKQASVLVTETSSQIKIVVSDPTQTNAGSINLELKKIAASLASASSGITVSQLSPSIKLAVNVNGAKGKTFKVVLNK